MTRIYKQRRNISESFIIVREKKLKSDLIYLLRQDQRCYVYVFMFFQSVQAFFYPGRIWSTGRTPGGMFFMVMVSLGLPM